MYDIQTKESEIDGIIKWETKVSYTTKGLALSCCEAVKKYYGKEVRAIDVNKNVEIENIGGKK